MTKTKSVTPIKICGCGQHFLEVPAFARYQASNDWLQGWYWECGCLSTMFVQDFVEAVAS